MSDMVAQKLTNNVGAIKSLLFTTLISLVFVGGILLGEISTDIERISKMTGGIATVVSIVFGIKILHIALNRNNYIMIAAIISVWLSEVSFSFNVFSVHTTNTLYNITIVLVMILLYRHEFVNRDKRIDIKNIPKTEKKIIKEIKKWQ